eukprot:s267_g41.t1
MDQGRRLDPRSFPLGDQYHSESPWYAGEEGMICRVVRDETRDSEGRWIRMKLSGTTIAQLRNWAVTRGSQYAFWARSESDQRRQLEGVGYLLEARIAREDQIEPWMNNCSPEGGGVDETRDLLDTANRLRGPPLARPPGAPLEGEAGQQEEPPPPKRLSSRQRVKQMIEKAKWGASGTPVDPKFKRPIKLKIKLKVKRKRSSSSSSDGSRSPGSSQSSDGGLGTEHRLKTISRKLPGYLTRQSVKEAIQLLAAQSGEDLKTYQVFNGDVLTALDVLCQRIKSLEFFQQGAEANLAMQTGKGKKGKPCDKSKKGGAGGPSELRNPIEECPRKEALRRLLAQKKASLALVGAGPKTSQEEGFKFPPEPRSIEALERLGVFPSFSPEKGAMGAVSPSHGELLTVLPEFVDEAYAAETGPQGGVPSLLSLGLKVLRLLPELQSQGTSRDLGSDTLKHGSGEWCSV